MASISDRNGTANNRAEAASVARSRSGPHSGPMDEALADDDEIAPLGRAALEVASSWAVIGIFLVIGMACIHYMSLILIPVTLAIVVGMILGIAADRLGALGVPRFGIALLLSGLVAALSFFIINSLIEPLTMLANEGPSFVERTVERIMPHLERMRWLNINAETLRMGPISIERLLENSSSILAVVTTNLTPAIVQGLLFFAALLLFLYSRLSLRRTLIMSFPKRHQRLMAIRVINATEQVLGHYFATASIMYAGLGILLALIAYLSGFGMPLLWGLLAFLSCFVPFLGITVMTIAVAAAGILTHEVISIGLIPAAVFFLANLVMENLLFPAVMGRQMEINPFLVFIAIVFWTWMWGAIGAMLALPLSLIVMTVFDELLGEKKPVPQLPG